MKGLNKFYFIITPDELENILYDFYCCKAGFQHIPDNYPYNYIELDKYELLEKYRIFYDKLISGYKFEQKKAEKGFIIDESLRFFPVLLTDKLIKNGEGVVTIDFLHYFWIKIKSYLHI